MADAVERYDGLDAEAVRRVAGAAEVVLRASTGSVLDLAHEYAAAGAPPGLLVVADSQTAGRGRQGRVWHSPANAGVWMAALLRPRAPHSPGALAVRVGLRVVEAVAEVAPEASPQLKWPNDVIVHGRKAGGVLCEARWNGERLGWVAVGVGIDVKGPVPAELRDLAVALDDVAHGVTRIAVLSAVARRLWPLAELGPLLDDREREEFRRLRWAPDAEETGVAVDAEGALLVRRSDGSLDRRVVPL